MTKKPLPSALPVEGDIFLALPLWWSSMPDSRGYRLCALRQPNKFKEFSVLETFRKCIQTDEEQEKSFQKVNWTATEQQELLV